MHAAFARPALSDMVLAARAGKTARHLAVVRNNVLLFFKDGSKQFNSCKQPGFAGGVVCHGALVVTMEQ
jgi:hypothetical protein